MSNFVSLFKYIMSIFVYIISYISNKIATLIAFIFYNFGPRLEVLFGQIIKYILFFQTINVDFQIVNFFLKIYILYRIKVESMNGRVNKILNTILIAKTSIIEYAIQKGYYT